MATCYLVLGTPRSGTSLVAGLLHSLGVPMARRLGVGRWDTSEPNDWNPGGFFEDAGFVNYFHGLLGFPWADRDVALSPPSRRGLAELIAGRCREADDWGVKEVGLAWVLPQFVELCPLPVRAVLCRRDPERCAASWAARAGCPGEEARAVVAAAARQLDRNLPALPTPPLEVDFERLADEPSAVVGELAGFTGRRATAGALALPRPELRRF